MTNESRISLNRRVAAGAALGLVLVGAGATYVGLRLGRADGERDATMQAGAAQRQESAAISGSGHAAAMTGTDAGLPDVQVTLTEEATARAGIVVEPVARGTSALDLRLPAVVEPNAYRQVVVTPLVGGRVIRVSAELGDGVRRGETMAQIYSPPLAEAQTRYVSARAMLDAYDRELQRTEKLVEIGSAREGGEKLAADKGINLPDTALDLPALTAQDLQDLDTVVATADLVGLSFCQSADDVRRLRAELAARGASTLGLMLKIETQRGFAALPSILLAAMEGPTAGVMIARGDLAVECGYERLAEVQEEMLWACEAAHLPVVWATQVLETLARTGRPSRAEITDAAMGERAECVMLNKGPHIMDAIRMLDDILRRMQEHQSKKRPLLRALRAWRGALDGQGAPG